MPNFFYVFLLILELKNKIESKLRNKSIFDENKNLSQVLEFILFFFMNKILKHINESLYSLNRSLTQKM